MGVQFVIGGSTFGPLSSTGDRQGLDLKYGNRAHKLIRYSPFGTKGNLKTDGLSKGRKVVALMRYLHGTESDLEALIKADMDAWEGAEVTITYAGLTFKRCELDDNGMNKIKEVQSRGIAGYGGCWVDVMAVFTEDAGEDE